jgi:hypothetical protein
MVPLSDFVDLSTSSSNLFGDQNLSYSVPVRNDSIPSPDFKIPSNIMPNRLGDKDAPNFIRGSNKVKTHGQENEDIGTYCDTLPLFGGSNYWSNETNTLVRIHQDRDKICGPKVVIIGKMKCGTNTVGKLLSRHPRVAVNRCETGQNFCNMTNFQGQNHLDLNIWEGNDFTMERVIQHNPEWLHEMARRLPWTDGKHNISVHKSPSYFNTDMFPETPKLTKGLLPNAKIVVSLCNPSTRIFSEYQHYKTNNPDHIESTYKRFNLQPPVNFGELVKDLFRDDDDSVCQNNRPFCEKNRERWLGNKGKYLHSLQDWLNAYDQNDILVLNMDDDDNTTAKKLLAHIGHDILPEKEYPYDEINGQDASYHNKHYSGRNSAYQMFPYAMEKLEAYHKDSNLALAEFLRQDFPLTWNTLV